MLIIDKLVRLSLLLGPYVAVVILNNFSTAHHRNMCIDHYWETMIVESNIDVVSDLGRPMATVHQYWKFSPELFNVEFLSLHACPKNSKKRLLNQLVTSFPV